MDSQLNFFRPSGWRECLAATNGAIEWVMGGADDDFVTFAMTCLHLTALRRAYFTADAVAELMAEVASQVTVPETKDNRAMGGVMRLGAKEGWIEPTDVYLTCRRQNQHRCPKREWRSLLFRNGKS